MINKLIFKVALVLLCIVPAKSAPAGELHSAVVFNSGILGCSDVTHYTQWANPTGQTIYIRSCLVWMGSTGGSVMDIVTAIVRTSDNNLLIAYGQDAYTPSSGSPIHLVKSFTPTYIPLGSTDSLTIVYFCHGPAVMHTYSIIWYLTTQP